MYSRYWRFIGIPQPGLTKVPSLRFLQALLQIGLVRSTPVPYRRLRCSQLQADSIAGDRRPSPWPGPPMRAILWATLPRRRCNVAAAIAALSSQILQIGCKQALDLANRLTVAASASPVIAEQANFEAFYQAETGRPYDRAHAHSSVFAQHSPRLPSVTSAPFTGCWRSGGVPFQSWRAPHEFPSPSFPVHAGLPVLAWPAPFLPAASSGTNAPDTAPTVFGPEQCLSTRLRRS